MKKTFFRLLAMTLLLAAWGASAQAEPEASPAPRTVRIGFQKSSTLITILKAQGKLDEDLAEIGVKVHWAEFIAGPPLLEALNTGGVDLSADVADTVPVFAQAAGANLVYFAQEAPSPTAQGILVPANSPIKAVADLKGKNVAVTKGTGGHYLLIAALARAGLTFKDVSAKYLAPPDGRAAFIGGSVDAWVTWDPFLAAAEKQAGAQVLADGSDGVASYQRYYLASSKFAAANPDVLEAIFKRLAEAGKWVKSTSKDAAALLAPIWGVDPAVVERANGRRSYEIRAVSVDNISEQQKIADTFLKEGLLPKVVEISKVELWRPAS